MPGKKTKMQAGGAIILFAPVCTMPLIPVLSMCITQCTIKSVDIITEYIIFMTVPRGIFRTINKHSVLIVKVLVLKKVLLT